MKCFIVPRSPICDGPITWPPAACAGMEGASSSRDEAAVCVSMGRPPSQPEAGQGVLEAAYEAWIDAPDDAERHRQAVAFQTACFTSIPSIPLGQYLPQAAWRSNVMGMPKGSAPVFWNVDKG